MNIAVVKIVAITNHCGSYMSSLEKEEYGESFKDHKVSSEIHKARNLPFFESRDYFLGSFILGFLSMDDILEVLSRMET